MHIFNTNNIIYKYCFLSGGWERVGLVSRSYNFHVSIVAVSQLPDAHLLFLLTRTICFCHNGGNCAIPERRRMWT